MAFTRKDSAIAAALLGGASIGAQTLLIRSLMTVFYGNELMVGVLPALWLVWVGIGSLLGDRLCRRRRPTTLLFSALILGALSATAFASALTRAARTVTVVPYGEYISFLKMVLFCAAAAPLPGLLFGASFAAAAEAAAPSESAGEPAGRVYAWEAAGAAALGILISLLTPFLSNLALFFLLFCTALMITARLTRNGAPLVLMTLCLLFTAAGGVNRLEKGLADYYWRSFGSGMKPTALCSTAHGETALVEFAGETWVYQNGNKVAPLPNDLAAQPTAAQLFCAHGRPRRALVIEGALNGLPQALLSFDSLQVTVTELDRRAFSFVARRYPGLLPPQLNVVHQDARRFLLRPQPPFDLIVVNSGNPSTAAANRFYTREFLRQAKRRLAPDGILAIPNLSSGENYLGKELLDFHRLMFNTLSDVFEKVAVLPGDQAIYLATDGDRLTFDLDSLTQRYLDGGAALPFFHPAMFAVLNDSLRAAELLRRIKEHSFERRNLDFAPASYLYDFLIWHKAVSGPSRFFSRLTSLSFGRFAAVAALVALLAGAATKLLDRRRRGASVTLAAALFGWTIMSTNLILLLAFQTLFGYIYAWLAALNAVFMIGMSAGAHLVNRNLHRFPAISLTATAAAVTAAAQLVLPAASFCRRMDAPILFLLPVFATGAIGGALFPLLCLRLHRQRGTADRGRLYAADVFGGGSAAAGAALLVPVFGFRCTAFLAAGAAFTALLLTFEKPRLSESASK